jgi:hypothetical protein
MPRGSARVTLWFVSGELPLPSAQLLVYRFGPDADFEGRLVGALERIETGGTLRVLDALFVTKDAETAELRAVGVRGDSAGSLVGPLLGFRLDPGERERATERALADSAEAVRELGERLEAGCSLAAVLVGHTWADALEDAVARTGGTPLASSFVDATALGEVTPHLLAALGR